LNIKQAKQEIKNTFLAYTKKKENGDYKLASIRQRPLLLMGPPGIGKTAIAAQAAQELHTSFVAYTMTHHTRQSAVGLPLIREKTYDGSSYSVTEYTMSEMIGSIYDEMNRTGRQEGILFLDEINCVSETLAPTMLQFLQCKKFGCHALPKGWIVVAAGNPPQYNKSVRDFDLVTLDRVRLIPVSEDYAAWREYAVEHHIHSAVLTYLDLKKDAFYCIERRPDGMAFVTARGWEDLSDALSVYEELDIEITTDFIREYLQHTETALDFKNYYELYQKYRDDYHIEKILAGHYEEEQVKRLKHAPFDEAVSVIFLMLSRLQEGFAYVAFEDAVTRELHKMLKFWKGKLAGMHTAEQAVNCYHELLEELRMRISETVSENPSGNTEKECLGRALLLAEEYEKRMQRTLHNTTLYHTESSCATAPEEVFQITQKAFSKQVEKRAALVDQTAAELNYAFDFLEKAFHRSQEMVIFVTELSSRSEAAAFIMEHGCEKFYQYNEDLLFYKKQKAFQQEISELEKLPEYHTI